MNKTHFKQVIESCKDIFIELDLAIDDNTLAELAERIYISEEIELSRSNNYLLKPSQAQPKPLQKPIGAIPATNQIIPPTEKQALQLEKHSEYLKSKGIDIKTIKTKTEASQVLGKLFNGEI